MPERRLLAALLALALIVWACAPTGSTRRVNQQIDAGDLAGARADLEARVQQRPDDGDARVNLGEVYYRIARDALDRERDEGRYLAYLERSVDEFVRAVELDPRDPRPHFFLAVMDTYLGDLDKALRGFNNTRRLEPSGVAYTNTAEIYIYRGDIRRAHALNDLGVRKGAPYGASIFNQMLIYWREGDLDRARNHFERLRAGYPEYLQTINVAKLPEAPDTFEAFASYCCGSPACGPYMKNACRDLSLRVQEREISEETVLKELRIEIERTRRMRKVYERRKELEIEIEDEAPR